MLEELDIPAWVAKATPDKRHFREAVHLVLTAISASTALRSTMVMKGGMLMAIRYNSTRFTKDADFSTLEKYVPGAENQLLVELDQQLEIANDHLSYDTMCRRQKTEIRPARPDANFPTLSLSIGYGQRSKPADRAKLKNGQASTVVQIDYSYNEAVYDVEILEIVEGKGLHAYSFLNLIAEKMRSLLQQPIRRRTRRQDVYDLNLLIDVEKSMTEDERLNLLRYFNASCKAREIIPNQQSFRDPKVQSMASEGYQDLAPEITGELPSFDVAYKKLQTFYENLPWEEVNALDSSREL